jgi:hypothetical protein
VVNTLVWKCWNRTWRAWSELIPRLTYWQRRNAASYDSRRKHATLDSS